MKAGVNPFTNGGTIPVRDGWACDSGTTGETVTAYALCRTSITPGPLSLVTVKHENAARDPASCDAGQKLIGG